LFLIIVDPQKCNKENDLSQRMIMMNSQGVELGGINPAIKRHLELEIRTLQNAPKDQHKLRHLLKVKQSKDKSRK
jgi:hypothetical protein